MKKDGSEACAKSVFRTARRTKKNRRRKTPIKSKYWKDNEMQVSKIASEVLMASATAPSPSVPGLAWKTILVTLKINNVATFSPNAAHELLERG